jgi:hypothetical protein
MQLATLRTHVTFRTSRFNQTEARPYFISSTEEDQPEWLVHVQEHVGFLARLRGKAGPGALRELLVAIHQVLVAGPDVERIRWHFEDVFMGGRSAGEGEPVSPRTAAEAAG